MLDKPMMQCKNHARQTHDAMQKSHVSNGNIVYLFWYSWVPTNWVGIIRGLDFCQQNIDSGSE